MMKLRFQILLLGLPLITGWALADQTEPADAPAFRAAIEGGPTIDLPTEQKGVGLYLFWASWCPYCKALMPHLQSINDEYGDQVTIYALNFRDQNDPAEYIDERGFDFLLIPHADDIAAQWGARATPALYIVDTQARIRFSLYDVLTQDPPGYDELEHSQRAERRAPFWAARIRQALDSLLESSVGS
jgi:thiol-disulfide isomerase/thioredoxin